MQQRRFGRTGWKVGEIGYGMWGMGGWTGSDDEESLISLQRAVDLGCNFFDTAWGYGAGHSEALLGQLVRANPCEQRVVVADGFAHFLYCRDWRAQPVFPASAVFVLTAVVKR